MAKRLLDRQVSLLRYLTSGGAIFGDEGAPRDPALQGIDPALLKLEARFSFDKRMEKIAGVFPRTFELLGAGREALVKEFVEACPPVDIGRLQNARQFCEFLCARAEHAPALPAYLNDVARCELALAGARVAFDDDAPDAEGSGRGSPHGCIRRARAVALLRSAYDIRPIFEHAARGSNIAKRETLLAIVPQPRAEEPKILELAPAVFDLLCALDDWTERAAFAAAPETDDLIGDLANADLLEIRR